MNIPYSYLEIGRAIRRTLMCTTNRPGVRTLARAAGAARPSHRPAVGAASASAVGAKSFPMMDFATRTPRSIGSDPDAAALDTPLRLGPRHGAARVTDRPPIATL